MKNVKVVKAGIGYTIGNYLLKGISFFTLPIFSRLLSIEEFGDYGVFLSYESVCVILIGLAIHTSYKNARYKYGLVNELNDDRVLTYENYRSNTVIMLIISYLVWITFSFLLVNYTSGLLGLGKISVLLLITYSFSNAVIQCYNANVSLFYEYKGFLLVSYINTGINVGLSILLMKWIIPNEKYFGRITGMTVSASIIAIYIVIKFLKSAKVNNFSQSIKWGLIYSLPIVPHGLSQVVLAQFDRIMIRNMIGAAKAGLYSFAFNIYLIQAITLSSLDNVWTPWVYEKLNEKDTKRITNVSNCYMTLMMMFSAILMLISPELVLILGGSNYLESVYCVIPIIAGGYFSFLYTFPSSVEYFYEKTNYIAIGTTCAAIINVGLNYYFITKYGYFAAAYTTLVTYILYFVFHMIITKKILKFSGYSIMYMLLCGIGMIIGLAICLFIINVTVIRWVLAAIVFAIAIFYEERKLSLLRDMLIVR